MANKFQVKRTAVSGRTPNTTSSGNTHFIDTGELALNLTDGKMFSSNGTAYFEVGANLINASITNILSVAAVSANGSNGTSGQVLTSNGTSTYWSTVSGGGGGNTSFSRSITAYTANGTANSFTVTGGYIVGQLDVFVNGVRYNSSDFTATDSTNVNLVDTPNSGDTVELVSYVGTGGNFTNGQSISVVDLVVTGGLTANGTTGTSGQVLTSNGATGSPYWTTVSSGGASVNVANTAPVSPSSGDLWWDTETGRMYVYYDDGTSSQWVDASPGIPGPAGANGTDGTDGLDGAGFTSSTDAEINSLGVGTPSSNVTGEIRAAGTITAFYSSDERIKTNITNIVDPIEKLMSMRGVTFSWTDEEIDRRGGVDGKFVRAEEVGVIAQDVEKVLPQVVAERPDGFKAVRYEMIVPLLIESIKQQQREIEELRQIIGARNAN